MQEQKDFFKKDKEIEFLPSQIKKPINFAVSILLTAFHNTKKLSDNSVVRESVIKEGLLISKLLRRNEIDFVQEPIQDQGILNWWSLGTQEAWRRMPITSKTPFVWSLITLQSFFSEFDNDDENIISKSEQYLVEIGVDDEGIGILREDIQNLFKCFVEKDITRPVEDMVLDQNTIQILSTIKESTEYLDLPLVE